MQFVAFKHKWLILGIRTERFHRLQEWIIKQNKNFLFLRPMKMERGELKKEKKSIGLFHWPCVLPPPWDEWK